MHWQLTDEDGLPSMTIYDILQDDEGYIWLGTANGICKYDGNKVTVFDDPGLKDLEMIDIEKDAWNRIWTVNLSGQIAYVSEGRVHLLQGISPLEGKALIKLHVEGNRLHILCKESHGKKYKHFMSYQLSKDDMLQLPSEISTPNIYLYMIESDHNNNVVLIGRTKQQLEICRYDSLFNFNSQQLNIPSLYNKKWAPPIGDFGIYKDQKIFAMAKGYTNKALGLFHIRDTSIQLLHVFEGPTKVNGAKMTGSDFWLMTTEGIWTTNLEDMSEEPLRIEKILEGVNTNNILLDREGSYWVVTTGQGVIVIPSLSLKEVEVVYNNIPVKEVYSLLPDADFNRVISGHPEGIVSVHGTAQTSQVIDINRVGKIRDIFRASDGKFYCVTNLGSVVLDSLLQIEYRYSHGASKKMIIDQNNRFWVGASHGVYTFTQTQINNTEISLSDFIFAKRTYALHEDINQRIWIGSIGGLYYCQDSLIMPFNTQDAINYYITDFAETENGTLWVSTQTHGILAIKDNQVIQRYSSDNGLSGNNCTRLFWDGQLLWICTNQGLNYLEPHTGKIAHLNKTDGLPGNEVKDVAVLNDQVWVGTSKGLVYFPKNMVHHNTVAPLVHLTNFRVWDEPYVTSTHNQLSAKQNNLAFEFVGIALKAKKTVSYKYRITDIDHDWVYTSTPVARYPVVNPGNYRFEVYAINEDGVESEHPAVLVFSVAVPWWRRWWVVTLSLMFLTGVIGYFIRRQLRKEEQRRAVQTNIDQLRQQALQTQMNPHFIFNALSAIQKSMTTNEPEKALLYLSRFAKLIRSIFEYSKVETITLEEEVDFLNLYLDLEKLRFKNKVIVDLSVDPSVEQHLYSTLLPPLLLQPLVENAFKHGLFHKEEEGHLKLRFAKHQNYLCFLIEDNGVGRERAKKLSEKNDIYQSHQSSGISNIKERLSIINSKSGAIDFPTLVIEDLWEAGQPAGTRIQVYIYCKNFELKL